MKKIIFILALIVLTQLYADVSIEVEVPNGDFINWSLTYVSIGDDGVGWNRTINLKDFSVKNNRVQVTLKNPTWGLRFSSSSSSHPTANSDWIGLYPFAYIVQARPCNELMQNHGLAGFYRRNYQMPPLCLSWGNCPSDMQQNQDVCWKFALKSDDQKSIDKINATIKALSIKANDCAEIKKSPWLIDIAKIIKDQSAQEVKDAIAAGKINIAELQSAIKRCIES